MSGKKVIEIKNLYKSFGETKVLKGISFDVDEGETVAVIGNSGSGKSTMLQCINRILEADSGEIYAAGYEITNSKININEARQHIGMVFQQFNLFKHLSVLDNVTLGPVTVKKISLKEARERGKKELEKVGLSHRIHHYPAQLSGGEQQRVAIARALAMDPTVILFDEPTSSLDPSLTGEVLEVMRKLAEEKMTMVVVTHEMGFAKQVADRIALVENGIIAEYGRTEDIFSSDSYPKIKAFVSTALNMWEGRESHHD